MRKYLFYVKISTGYIHIRKQGIEKTRRITDETKDIFPAPMYLRLIAFLYLLISLILLMTEWKDFNGIL